MNETPFAIVQRYIINSPNAEEIAGAFRRIDEELSALRKAANDHKAFISWIVDEIDDYQQLIRIVKRARENPMNMNAACEESIALFLQYVAETAYCDHSTGVCCCDLRQALGIDDGYEPIVD